MPRVDLRLLLPLLVVAGCPPLPPELVTCEEADACTTGGATTSGDVPTSDGDGGVHTATGDGVESTTADAETTGQVGTTGQADAPPQIVEGAVIPDLIMDNGLLSVHVSTQHADGVRMQLDTGEPVELTQTSRGEYHGEIAVFTGFDNGDHTAVFTPWRDALEGDPLAVAYTVALPTPGAAVKWDVDTLQGDLAAIGVLPDGNPVEFTTIQDNGAPRCFLVLRDTHGKFLKSEPLLGTSYCKAIDLEVDPDSGVMYVLVERKTGDGTVWWAGKLGGWAAAPQELGIGAVGDTAHALAAREDVVAVCGARKVATLDKYDALAVMLPDRGQAQTRVFDYVKNGVHLFGETVRDCTFAGDRLVLVGEASGKHDNQGETRDRLLVIESDVAAAGETTWTVAGLAEGVQSRGTALDLDGAGRYVVTGYTCLDVCDPTGELRIYEPGGELTSVTSLGQLGSPWFGPHAVAWSPAGYAVVALGELQDQQFVFKVQAFVPNVPAPLWTFLPTDKQGLQLALAVAVGPYGEVYAGGIAADDHPVFVRIGG